MIKTLKPCPECGSNNLNEEASGVLEIQGVNYCTCYIECADCLYEGPNLELNDSEEGYNNYSFIREAWNKHVQ